MEIPNINAHVVYIKDEDTLNPDDLLTTAYVRSDGTFSATWFVDNVDADGVADIYAVFEGDETFYRLTTCYSGPTLAFGGSGQQTIRLPIYGQAAPPDPIPPPSPTPTPSPGREQLFGNEFMELYYS